MHWRRYLIVCTELVPRTQACIATTRCSNHAMLPATHRPDHSGTPCPDNATSRWRCQHFPPLKRAGRVSPPSNDLHVRSGFPTHKAGSQRKPRRCEAPMTQGARQMAAKEGPSSQLKQKRSCLDTCFTKTIFEQCVGTPPARCLSLTTST